MEPRRNARWKGSIISMIAEHNNSGIVFSQMNEIVPRIYLSDLFSAQDEEKLEKCGITHILSVLEYIPDLPKRIPARNKLLIKIQDQPQVEIHEYFEKAFDFINKILAENDTNRILVHCFQGVSRSATVVCAYIMTTKDMSSIKAIKYAQSKRRIVAPNIGFRRQLKDYEIKLRLQKNSASPAEAPAPVTTNTYNGDSCCIA